MTISKKNFHNAHGCISIEIRTTDNKTQLYKCTLKVFNFLNLILHMGWNFITPHLLLLNVPKSSKLQAYCKFFYEQTHFFSLFPWNINNDNWHHQKWPFNCVQSVLLPIFDGVNTPNLKKFSRLIFALNLYSLCIF